MIEHFRRQIDSIRHQTYANWFCIISDDCSKQEIFKHLQDVVHGDERFAFCRNSSNLGFYYNFERCLSYVPEDVSFVAFSDQDDYWHPDKLSVLVSTFDEDTTLVYSDMNIVNEQGEVIHSTYWTTRKNNYTALDFLLFANTITGAASMIRKDLVDYVLPFPKKIGDSYHDHWIGCIALSRGKVKYVKKPLYDYYQHSVNVLGHYTRSNEISMRDLREAFKRLRSGIRSQELLQYLKAVAWKSRDIYFNDIVRLILLAKVILLRCGDISGRKKALLRQFVRFEKSISALFMQAVKGKVLKRSTLGAESYCLRAAIVFKLMNVYMKMKKETYLQRCVGLLPMENSHAGLKVQGTGSLDIIKQKTAPLVLAIDPDASTSINMIIPTIDFKYFFGGYIGKFNLALRLADAGLH
ncbi:MAG TPA: glycosyltransferase, partial [Candidatus Hodarchaeales archaeon]|nr:glycosyltransferase [Candidatus Hodarchaeales archaeon]